MTHVIIVGGFLGAGKTTLLLQAAQQLTSQGYRVGLVTNDQGKNLVDTALITERAFPVTEVAGGCFCCNFPDLVRALTTLQQQVNPDVILAEPVGSCTDLLATTVRPLQIYHRDKFQLAPLTILLDPIREVTRFQDNVDYLYERQLAEAEIILLNKCDLLDTQTQVEKSATVAQHYRNAQIMGISARSGQGVAAWLDSVLQRRSTSPLTMDLDYQQYAEAEAALGWLNATGKIHADTAFSTRSWTESVLTHVADACRVHQAPIAHIKIYSQAGEAQYKASVIQSDMPLGWTLNSKDTMSTQLDFNLNIRVGTSPARLEQIVLDAMESIKPEAGSRYYFTHFECFSPLPPRPTHRIAANSPLES